MFTSLDALACVSQPAAERELGPGALESRKPAGAPFEREAERVLSLITLTREGDAAGGDRGRPVRLGVPSHARELFC